MSQWPRPSKTPWSSLAFLCVNALTLYILNHLHLSPLWLLPSVLLNIFFFWAERDIYKREKRNYDSWNKEMGYLMGVTDKLGRPLPSPKALRSAKPKKRKNKKLSSDIISGPQTV